MYVVTVNGNSKMVDKTSWIRVKEKDADWYQNVTTRKPVVGLLYFLFSVDFFINITFMRNEDLNSIW